MQKGSMLPVTHGDKFTQIQVLLYTIILFAVTLLPFAVGMSGLIYLVGALIFNSILVYAIKICRNYSDKIARSTFRYSILYLAGLFAVFLLFDHYFKIV